jgi:tetratricopeptide (TPR) repeat protein
LRGGAAVADRSQRLLADPLADLLLSWVQPLRRAGLAQALQALEAFTELRGGGDAGLLLPLAVLRHAQGQTDAALAALERGLALCLDEPRLRAQMHLMLGRVLMDSGRDRARAVSECQRALALDPALAVARFWLGRAIAELIQRDTRVQAHQALTDYLSQGAPQGRRREALRLLDTLGDVAPDASRPPL